MTKNEDFAVVDLFLGGRLAVMVCRKSQPFRERIGLEWAVPPVSRALVGVVAGTPRSASAPRGATNMPLLRSLGCLNYVVAYREEFERRRSLIQC
ncbi:MAG TPA: hypothetical protein PKE66_11130, partial [Pyrinomonadaceae bacterium]|nr:hypothetical protein [Pyrinomonadaceae bacterium]